MANPAFHTPGPAGHLMPPQGDEKNLARCLSAPNAPGRNGLRGIVLASMRLGARTGFRHRCGRGETLGCPCSLEAAVVPMQASALGHCLRQVRAAVRSGVPPIRPPGETRWEQSRSSTFRWIRMRRADRRGAPPIRALRSRVVLPMTAQRRPPSSPAQVAVGRETTDDGCRR